MAKIFKNRSSVTWSSLLVGLLPFSPKFVFSRRCACVVRPIRQTGLPVVSGAAKRKMVGQASTCCVVRCVLRVYGRPGVCALLVVNIHQGLWFAVCRVCAMRCACVLLWFAAGNRTWPAIDVQRAASSTPACVINANLPSSMCHSHSF